MNITIDYTVASVKDGGSFIVAPLSVSGAKDLFHIEQYKIISLFGSNKVRSKCVDDLLIIPSLNCINDRTFEFFQNGQILTLEQVDDFVLDVETPFGRRCLTKENFVADNVPALFKASDQYVVPFGHQQIALADTKTLTVALQINHSEARYNQDHLCAYINGKLMRLSEFEYHGGKFIKSDVFPTGNNIQIGIMYNMGFIPLATINEIICSETLISGKFSFKDIQINLPVQTTLIANAKQVHASITAPPKRLHLFQISSQIPISKCIVTMNGFQQHICSESPTHAISLNLDLPLFAGLLDIQTE